MKWLRLLVSMLIVSSCASVNKEKSDTYESMLRFLRQGDIEEAINIIDKSSFESFDFYVSSDRYQNPIKFVGVKKTDVLSGLRAINQTLKSCRGNQSCFEDLNWSSARWFYDYSNKLGLKNFHLHSKYKVTIFDGEVIDGSASWRNTKKYNYSELLTNYKKRTDSQIKNQFEDARARKQGKLSESMTTKMSSAGFRKCLTNFLVEFNKQNLKVIHRNYGVALNTRSGRKNEEITKRAYKIEVQTTEDNIEKYSKILASQKGGSLNNCQKHNSFIEANRLDLERMLNNR